MNEKGSVVAPGGKRNKDGSKTTSATGSGGPIRQYGWFLLFLLGIFLWLFYPALDPSKVQFSNDAPLGVYNAEWIQVPKGFSGVWHDLNSIGTNQGTFTIIFSHLFRMMVGALWYSKIYPPVTLLFLGSCAWLFFRCLKLNPLACALGGLAVVLNSGFFSATCWGIGTQEIGVGFDFLALAAVSSSMQGKRWVKLILAGLAVGMGIMEAIDVGVLVSILVAAYVCWSALIEEFRPLGRVERIVVLCCLNAAVALLSGILVLYRGSDALWVLLLLLIAAGALNWCLVTKYRFANRVGYGVARTGLVAVCAAFIATHALSYLIATQIKGVAGTGQDVKSKADRWDWATTWSFPKRETLGLFIPGLFGYRMDTPDGGNYWGATGRDPSWDRHFASGGKEPAQGAIRFSGGGAYNGVIVLLIAVWAAMQSFRKTNPALSPDQRKYVWFWTGVGVIGLLLSYGRFAPFYRLVYALPYISTIRNPSKFVMFFNFAAVVLFAYGVHGLAERYLAGPLSSAIGLGSRLSNWWRKAAAFDKRWVVGCFFAIAFSLAGWLVFSSFRPAFEKYLETVQFEPPMTHAIAAFSIRQVGWYILFLVASVGLMTLILSGAFAGKRARAAGILLGLILVVDLVRANQPWVKYFDYKDKNATNPIIDFLREKPYEHRVAMIPLRLPPQFSTFEQLYRIEWAQHAFQYYNIQSLDVVQMPRTAQDLAAFNAVMYNSPLARRWELTNMRYLLAPAIWPVSADRTVPFIELANQQIDPVQHRFRIIAAFNLAAKPDVKNVSNLEDITIQLASPTNGQWALYDFTGALPRAKLFSQWKVMGTNQDTAAMKQWVETIKTSALPAEWINAFMSQSPADQATLKELFSEQFNPAQTVLLDKPLPTPATAGETNQDAGTVEFTSYSPKHIKLKAVASTPAVLLLNDKYDPTWQVKVDGKPAELLRANFIMRGVALPPGEHTIDFTFNLDPKPMYVSIAGIVLGISLIGYLAVSRSRNGSTASQPGKADASDGKPK